MVAWHHVLLTLLLRSVRLKRIHCNVCAIEGAAIANIDNPNWILDLRVSSCGFCCHLTGEDVAEIPQTFECAWAELRLTRAVFIQYWWEAWRRRRILSPWLPPRLSHLACETHRILLLFYAIWRYFKAVLTLKELEEILEKAEDEVEFNQKVHGIEGVLTLRHPTDRPLL